MNDPELAADRYRAVVSAYKNDIPESEAFGFVQKHNDQKFEGHLLAATIKNVYEEGIGIE